MARTSNQYQTLGRAKTTQPQAKGNDSDLDKGKPLVEQSKKKQSGGCLVQLKEHGEGKRFDEVKTSAPLV